MEEHEVSFVYKDKFFTEYLRPSLKVKDTIKELISRGKKINNDSFFIYRGIILNDDDCLSTTINDDDDPIQIEDTKPEQITITLEFDKSKSIQYHMIKGSTVYVIRCNVSESLGCDIDEIILIADDNELNDDDELDKDTQIKVDLSKMSQKYEYHNKSNISDKTPNHIRFSIEYKDAKYDIVIDNRKQVKDLYIAFINELKDQKIRTYSIQFFNEHGSPLISDEYLFSLYPNKQNDLHDIITKETYEFIFVNSTGKIFYEYLSPTLKVKDTIKELIARGKKINNDSFFIYRGIILNDDDCLSTTINDDDGPIQILDTKPEQITITLEFDKSKSIQYQMVKGSTVYVIRCNVSESLGCDTSEIILIADDNELIDDELDKDTQIKVVLPKMSNADMIQESTKQSPHIIDTSAIDEMHLEFIGRGGQSEVFKVVGKEKLALKVLNVSNENRDSAFKAFKNLLTEFELLESLHHRNIVRVYGICWGDETHKPSILLELCDHNLSDVVKELSDIEKVTIIYELGLALREVHAHDIIHRDVNPGNVLLDQLKHVKLSDFGISRLVDFSEQKESMTIVGTPNFMAPELLNEDTHYTNKVDVYSFGVVVFYILTNGNIPKISIVDIGNGKMAKIPPSINDVSRKLITRCWSFDPNDRPTFADIVDEIRAKHFKLIDGVEKKIAQIESFLST